MKNDVDQVQCPFCDGTETKLFAAFGSQLSVSTYWCDHCHTAFEKLKWTRTQKSDLKQ
jgi:transposase-like protein